MFSGRKFNEIMIFFLLRSSLFETKIFLKNKQKTKYFISFEIERKLFVGCKYDEKMFATDNDTLTVRVMHTCAYENVNLRDQHRRIIVFG